MGKNKLRKFAEMEQFPRVLQVPFGKLQAEGFPMRGRWHEDFFRNPNPIVLELGCGRGEYTVGLAKEYPERNFIGIDIKGARMWAGAKEAHLAGMENVG
ncbi:MAG: tRNA (guanosine(46)-N7)-methyltransferase TrmB, partial [Muribaculaceae bacterium]|nr:tRNA (guanosine(46)-N7)-methyltransferase TrmB [Muribaculaceae bacterium]